MKKKAFVSTFLFVFCNTVRAAQNHWEGPQQINPIQKQQLPTKKIEWSNDLSEAVQVLQKELFYFLKEDKLGNYVNINTKTDDEIKSFGKRCAEVLKERHYVPFIYSAAPTLVFKNNLSRDEYIEFGMGERNLSLLFETEFSEIRSKAVNDYHKHKGNK